jgi:glycine betaine/proline transport system ATP-binding protein
MTHSAQADGAREMAVACQGLWKIFGKNSQAALVAARDQGMGKDEVLQRFGCVLGVVDATFEVLKGEIFCLMGLSGSGKSTLVRHVNRLIEPSAGKVIVEGVDINALDAKALRRLRSERIGMVFQHMALWPHRSIRDNVAYGLEVRGIDKRKRYEAADQALAKVKLDGWQHRYPDELSGGMQQRVGLARALAADPHILLMDEPFSALDPLIRRELQDEFLELSRQVQKSTLFITHDLEEAVRVGQRVAVMKDGVIEQIGTPIEIITRPQTNYVANFVSGMSTLSFLQAEDLMLEGPVNGTERSVSWDQDVRSVLGLFRQSDAPVAVTRDGAGAGTITRASLIDALLRQL